MEEYNDKLQELINSRLSERERKLNKMSKWNKKSKSFVLRPMVGFVAAACLIGALFLIPWENASDGTTGVRSASKNVDKLIKQRNFEDALLVIEKEIQSSDSILCVLLQDTSSMDEETEYNIHAMQMKINDLKEKRNIIVNKIQK
ncbi:MAG: hypothetical protein MJY52_00205 [Bacteroidaceae bacterium]|nr:hypothetical protein [Bacteroidaceae bacterium]